MSKDRMKLRSLEEAPRFSELLRRPWSMIAFGFGTGLSPYMPGTFGTLVGVPIAWMLCDIHWIPWLIVVVLLFAIGVKACDQAETELNAHDHRGIVWDEVVGYVVAMAFVPCHWMWFGLAFVLFRLFDILKPWPISWLDRQVQGGFGVMLDDVVAGIFSLAVLHVIVYYFGSSIL